MRTEATALVVLILVLSAAVLGCTDQTGNEQVTEQATGQPPRLPVVYHDLDSVPDSGIPVVIYFNEAWCSGCKDQQPLIQDILFAVGDKAFVVVLDKAANEDVAAQYGIDVAPNMVILDAQGQVVKTGYTGGDELKALVEGL